MSSDGHIDSLGQQYIGAITPSVSPDYQPGVVHGGSGVTSSSPVRVRFSILLLLVTVWLSILRIL